MKQTENLHLPILLNGDKYTKETQNEAFKKVDLHLGGLAKRVNNIVASTGESNIEIVDARRDNNTGVVYNTLGERIDTVSEQQVKLTNDIETTNSQLDIIALKKADKTQIWSMSNMGQDVKEAMTGGSVAVVGKNTILTENIVDGQVTLRKTNLKNNYEVFFKDSIKYNKTTNKLTIPPFFFKSLSNGANWVDKSAKNYPSYCPNGVIEFTPNNASKLYFNAELADNGEFPFIFKTLGADDLDVNDKLQLILKIKDKGIISKYNVEYEGEIFTNNSVTTSKLANKSVTFEKIDDNAKLNLPFDITATLKRNDGVQYCERSLFQYIKIQNGDINNNYYIKDLWYAHPSFKTRRISIVENDGTSDIRTLAYEVINGSDNIYPDTEVITMEKDGIKISLLINWKKVKDNWFSLPMKSTLLSKFIIEEKTTSEIDTNIKIDTNIEIITPPKVCTASGRELNIYYDNIIRYSSVDKVNSFEITGFDTNYNDKASCVFTDKNGNWNISAKLSNIDRSNLISKTININNVKSTVGNGLTKKVLFIGDSMTAAGVYASEIVNLFSKDVMNVELLGTRGSGSAKHEGRSGWRAYEYVNEPTGIYGDKVSNAFFNPTTSKFDFSYYMQQQGYTSVDYVFINLGTNDISRNNYNTPDEIVTYFDYMINSIKSYNPNIKIGIWLMPMPCQMENRQRTLKDKFLGLTKKFIEYYGNREDENLFLVPVYLNVDPLNDFKTTTAQISARNDKTMTICSDHIHPSNIGYYKIADVIFAYIKYFASL